MRCENPKSHVERFQSDKRGMFDKVVYELLYAGALGSMLFDLMDPLRSWTWSKLPLVVLVFGVIADFWHLNLNLTRLLPRTILRMLWDSLITILMTASYFTLSSALTAQSGIDISKISKLKSDAIVHVQDLKDAVPTLDFWTSAVPAGLLLLVMIMIQTYNFGIPDSFRDVEKLLLVPLLLSAGGFVAIVFVYIDPPKDFELKYRAILSVTIVATVIVYISYVSWFTNRMSRHLQELDAIGLDQDRIPNGGSGG